MMPYYADESITLHHADALVALSAMPDESVDCIVTSPPYFGLRDYGVDGQIGAESSPVEFVAALVGVFAEARRVLAKDGTLWLNLGDSYSAKRSYQVDQTRGAPTAHRIDIPYDTTDFLPAKNLIGVPWRVALALQDSGWILRSDIIWAKPNGMPESIKDRVSSKHEYVFMFSKSPRYWFDLDAIREPLTSTSATALNWARDTKEADVPGQSMRQHRTDRTPYLGMSPQSIKSATGVQRVSDYGGGGKNPGDVWTIPTQPFTEAHFACMPVALAERCVQAGCKPAGIVLDPFSGSGTTGLAATKHGRKYIGIDLNATYLDLSLRTRLAQVAM